MPNPETQRIPLSETAFVVFGNAPLADARKRGWGEAGRAAFKNPAPPQALLGRLRVYHFENAPVPERADTSRINYRRQQGADFAERLQNCLDQLAEAGHRHVILVGTDCPELSDNDIATAYRAIQSGGSALGPDDKGGVYLIAIQLADRYRLAGIQWCHNVDYTQLRTRLAHRPLRQLVRRIDLDDTNDLRRVARSSSDPAFRRTAERILRDILPSLARHRDVPPLNRGFWIRRMLNYRDAPPARAAA